MNIALRFLLCSACAGIFAAVPAKPVIAQERVRINLDSGWSFRLAAAGEPSPSSTLKQWRPATVPGDIHTDLEAQHLIPPPFYGANESSLQWIDKKSWEYRRTFVVTPRQYKYSHADLVFDGLDTLAVVYLNGVELLHADNQFRTWRIPAHRFLHVGTNTLRVIFASPIMTLQPQLAAMPYHLIGQATGPLPGDPVRGPTVEPYIRKADYGFGWDWGPRFVTIGIWKPVHLEFWQGARLADVFIEQTRVTSGLATLAAHITVEADRAQQVQIRFAIRLHRSSRPVAAMTYSSIVDAGTTTLTLPAQIRRPHLWWPNGYGAQTRYFVSVQVLSSRNALDSSTFRIGLRSIQLRRVKDQWGIGFEFVVNGIPIFAKGANVVPFDSFPARVPDEKIKLFLRSARSSSMNMLRVWGGGYYEPDLFYDLCDRYGLLLWQDFMFTGGLYPGAADFFGNVRAEARDQILRLRNHPSLALLCGNNEGEIGWFFWSGQQRLKQSVSPTQRDRIWGDYLRLFTGLLPESVVQYSPQTAYWSSTPGTNFQAGERDVHSGDQHTYAVWHGSLPFSAYDTENPRFMTEYGFGSYPELHTILTYAGESDLWLHSPAMLAHQKSHEGNQDILRELENLYGNPVDFESFVYLSQVQQADAVKYSTEHLRRNRPQNMGALYWQLNDCWPGASWSGMDYYGRWKALQYYARRFFAPVLVSPYEEGNDLVVQLVNDRPRSFTGYLTLELQSLDGKALLKKRFPCRIAGLASDPCIRIPENQLLAHATRNNLVLRATLQSASGQVLSENDHFFAPVKELELRAPNIRLTHFERNGRYYLRLHADAVAVAVGIQFSDLHARAEDNFFNLLGGETRVIEITGVHSSQEAFEGIGVVTVQSARTLQATSEAWIDRK